MLNDVLNNIFDNTSNIIGIIDATQSSPPSNAGNTPQVNPVMSNSVVDFVGSPLGVAATLGISALGIFATYKLLKG